MTRTPASPASSANLLSSARTGAVPAVATRFLARQDSEICAVIRCGPINRACLRAILSQMPSLKRVICHDLSKATAQAFVDWSKTVFGIASADSVSLKDTLEDSDVVTVAASRQKAALRGGGWFKSGATVLLTGPLKAEDPFWLNSTIVYDNIHMHEAYVLEALAAPDRARVLRQRHWRTAVQVD